LHNKPKAAVHPGQKLTGPKEEEEEEEDDDDDDDDDDLTEYWPFLLGHSVYIYIYIYIYIYTAEFVVVFAVCAFRPTPFLCPTT
jgi:quinol-cytochrome oxidoreductase complex cytochrome b subunit